MDNNSDILRKLMIEKRKSLSSKIVEEKSNIITEKILETDIYKKAENIFIYISFGNEVSTYSIINKAWTDKKNVAVPATTDNKNMYFMKINDFSNLKKKNIGTLEPNINFENELIPNEKSIFIVPGLVFDNFGNRIGYGAGYYDRYISKYSINNNIIGICYNFQIINKIFAKPHDKKMNFIITEKQIIKENKNE